MGTLFGAQTCVPPSFAPFNCCKIGICYSEAPWSYNTQTFDKCNYLYRTSLYIKAFKWKQNILFPLCNVGSGENRCRPYYPQIRWYSKMSACLSSIVQSLEHNHIEQFWSFTSSKVKRTRILEKQTSMIRISDASNSLDWAVLKLLFPHSINA